MSMMHLDKMDKTLAKIYSTEDISAAAALILPPLQVGIMWFMVLYGLVRFLNMNFNAAFARGTSYDYDDYGDEYDYSDYDDYHNHLHYDYDYCDDDTDDDTECED